MVSATVSMLVPMLVALPHFATFSVSLVRRRSSPPARRPCRARDRCTDTYDTRAVWRRKALADGFDRRDRLSGRHPMQIRPVGSEQLARHPVACLQFGLGNAGIGNVHRPHRTVGELRRADQREPRLRRGHRVAGKRRGRHQGQRASTKSAHVRRTASCPRHRPKLRASRLRPCRRQKVRNSPASSTISRDAPLDVFTRAPSCRKGASVRGLGCL